MARNYKQYKYFENRPDIVKIFDDLEAFHNFCRIEMLPFNEADLYNKHSRIWQSYEKGTNPRPWKNKPRNNNYNNNKPYNNNQGARVNKQRSH